MQDQVKILIDIEHGYFTIISMINTLTEAVAQDDDLIDDALDADDARLAKALVDTYLIYQEFKNQKGSPTYARS